MYIAAVLEEANVETEIVEMRFLRKPWIELKQIISDRKPQIIGIGSFSYNFHDATKIAGLAKNVDECIKTVVGGPHVSLIPQESILEPEVDFAVLGEGEYTMLDLIKALENDTDIQKVRGLIFKNNGIVQTPSRPLIQNLDDLPLPARHLVKMDKYRASEDATTILTSRGCAFKCIFCASQAMWGPNVRFRDPIKVVDEVESVKKHFGFNVIGFVDDVFTIHKNRTIKLCKELKRRNLDIKWDCSTRTDLLSKQLLVLMKKAGCRAIFLGVESGCQETLDRIKKGANVEQAEKVVRWAKEAGIETRLSLILGCPGENKKTVQKTIDFAKKLKDYGATTLNFNLLKVYPGTELFNHQKKFGITFIDKNWGYQHGAPLVSTCETDKLSKNERKFIAWVASEIERYWKIRDIAL
jgi:radical SAM superfamily enzyme YgiQ (UPF0313 family)